MDYTDRIISNPERAVPAPRPFICAVCQVELPRRAPQGRENGREWQCISCGEVYFAAVPDGECDSKIRDNAVLFDGRPEDLIVRTDRLTG